jgi:hypothetical protein
MGEWPKYLVGDQPIGTISVASEECLNDVLSLNSTAPTSGAWPAANLAIFLPFHTSAPFPIQQVGWINGATVSGNVDMGVYDAAGTRLGSIGSTAQAGVSVLQLAALSLTLDPGHYNMGFTCDNTTATITRISLGPSSFAFGTAYQVQAQTSAFPLPSTATLANPTSNLIIPAVALFAQAVA